jgi:hypothetical protein
MRKSQIEHLTECYGEWLTENGFPSMSADELLYEYVAEMTPMQRAWIQAFINIWNLTEQ